ncbi:hypothetical protein AC579_7463 [Pseudocercospora musae]|uniref:CCHC-type domain-containing protein n=1 Tax=Pseudocercospora musae TaxID=113226 RepID=A0A139H7I7_9PEZI|nr:hypothetical protein AC579_7463 [Pseudocercospora musae]
MDVVNSGERMFASDAPKSDKDKFDDMLDQVKDPGMRAVLTMLNSQGLSGQQQHQASQQAKRQARRPLGETGSNIQTKPQEQKPEVSIQQTQCFKCGEQGHTQNKCTSSFTLPKEYKGTRDGKVATSNAVTSVLLDNDDDFSVEPQVSSFEPAKVDTPEEPLREVAAFTAKREQGPTGQRRTTHSDVDLRAAGESTTLDPKFMAPNPQTSISGAASRPQIDIVKPLNDLTIPVPFWNLVNIAPTLRQSLAAACTYKHRPDAAKRMAEARHPDHSGDRRAPSQQSKSSEQAPSQQAKSSDQTVSNDTSVVGCVWADPVAASIQTTTMTAPPKPHYVPTFYTAGKIVIDGKKFITKKNLVDGGAAINIIVIAVVEKLGLTRWPVTPLDCWMANGSKALLQEYVYFPLSVQGVTRMGSAYVLPATGTYSILLSRCWMKDNGTQGDYQTDQYWVTQQSLKRRKRYEWWKSLQQPSQIEADSVFLQMSRGLDVDDRGYAFRPQSGKALRH